VRATSRRRTAGSRSTQPHILNPGTVWLWLVNFQLQPLYPRAETSETLWIGGWVGPAAGGPVFDRTKTCALLWDQSPFTGRPAPATSLWELRNMYKMLGATLERGEGRIISCWPHLTVLQRSVLSFKCSGRGTMHCMDPGNKAIRNNLHGAIIVPQNLNI
jgi:hypothetical protein